MTTVKLVLTVFLLRFILERTDLVLLSEDGLRQLRGHLCSAARLLCTVEKRTSPLRPFVRFSRRETQKMLHSVHLAMRIRHPELAQAGAHLH